MKKVLFCLLAGMVLVVGSCQSDDIANGGDTDTGTSTADGNGGSSRAVNFNYEGDAAAVRTQYDENGILSWSNNDKIRIISPAHEDSEDAHQHANYSIGANGGNTSGSFSYTEELEDPALTGEIVWNTAVEQHFYAYYPAESVEADPTERLGAITDIDAVSGSAVYHIPADQSLTATAAEEGSHPLAYTVAANVRVPVGEASSVQLKFHDFMNVLRIRVSNPNGKTVKGVKVSPVGLVQNLAGTVRVAPKEAVEAHINPVEYDDLTFTIPAESHNNNTNTPSPLSSEISVISATPTERELSYDIYLLPQQYAKNTLQITVMMGDDEDTSNDYTKFMSSDFAKGALKKVLFNIPNPQTHVYEYGIEMVDIPGGTFLLGDKTDTSVQASSHVSPVTLSDFQIGKYEFTQGQWEAVLNDAITTLQRRTGYNVTHYNALSQAGFRVYSSKLQRLTPIGTYVDTGITERKLWPGTMSTVYGALGTTAPAYNVPYSTITTLFLPILNILTGKTYRLPSEAQWEYAARGGNYTNDYSGATRGDWSKVAWTNMSSSPKVHDVGLLLPNDYDLYDMTGNVSEMCEDLWNDNYPRILPDNFLCLSAPTATHVHRGGSHSSRTTTRELYVNYRESLSGGTALPYIGFRLVIFNGEYNTPIE